MASRRDQLHSYQFMNQRVISAFVMRETDPAQSPLRRGIGALFGGLMVAILIGAGFGIYGILTRVGTDAWKAEGAVVVERESGASFVFRNGRLVPALNFASAKLAAGQPSPTVHRIAARSLAEVPRGTTIGIPGAPASLPAASNLVGFPWTACAVPGSPPRSALLVGARGPAGAGLGDRGLLVRDAERGMTYLVWHGRKHLVQDSRSTVPALFGAVTATPVGTAWLNALPSGVDIAALQVPDRGEPSGQVPNARNGDVLAVPTATGQQFYLVFDDGQAPITPLQQAVLNALFPAEPKPSTINAVTQLPQSNLLGTADPATQPPATSPELAPVNAGETICAVTTDPLKPPELSVGGSAEALSQAVQTPGASGSGRALADTVLVPSGKAAVVRVPGSGSFAIVTDLGIAYAVPSAEALALLGYSPGDATAVPNALIGRIPAGVTLDPAAATRPAVTAD